MYPLLVGEAGTELGTFWVLYLWVIVRIITELNQNMIQARKRELEQVIPNSTLRKYLVPKTWLLGYYHLKGPISSLTCERRLSKENVGDVVVEMFCCLWKFLCVHNRNKSYNRESLLCRNSLSKDVKGWLQTGGEIKDKHVFVLVITVKVQKNPYLNHCLGTIRMMSDVSTGKVFELTHSFKKIVIETR